MENLPFLKKILRLLSIVDIEVEEDEFDDELKNILRQCEKLELSIDSYIHRREG